MKTVEIVGYKRANLGKSESKRLRKEGMVPGVIYGGEGQVHFYAPAILFRELVYTDKGHFAKLNIEGTECEAILQDIQFHPVSEAIIHVDFLRLFEGKHIKMNIPVRPVGVPPGTQQGGKLIKKLRFITVKALPKNMPEHIDVDVSKLELGKSVKVGELEAGNYEIMTGPLVTILGIEIPRALKGKSAEEEEGETEAEAGEE